MADSRPDSKTHLEWTNVGLGLSFIAFDAILSHGLGLGVGRSLVIASIRCIIQLAVVAMILEKVFSTNNFWAVAGIAVLLNFMGTLEIAVVKCKRRFHNMFIYVFIGLLLSTIPISIIGAHFAMGVRPFWRPEQYIPIIGMLCGATLSGISVSVTYVLKELDENRDKTETYLAFGASRLEAMMPIAREALRLALTPTINQMSVLGIISIPGMMTGAILGGSSVQQAAKLQMVIMFMISSCSALSSIMVTVCALVIAVDKGHRIRTDRIDTRDHVVWRVRDAAARWVANRVVWVASRVGVKAKEGYEAVTSNPNGRGTPRDDENEGDDGRLLG